MGSWQDHFTMYISSHVRNKACVRNTWKLTKLCYLFRVMASIIVQGESCNGSRGSRQHYFILRGRIISDNVGHFSVRLSDLADILLILAESQIKLTENVLLFSVISLLSNDI